MVIGKAKLIFMHLNFIHKNVIVFVFIVQTGRCAPVLDDAENVAINTMENIHSPVMSGVIEEPDIVSCDHYVQWIRLVNIFYDIQYIY